MTTKPTAAAAQTRKRALLMRLREDTAGNVIAVMAAALLPTLALIGSGVDLGRTYLARTNLQAACDSGSLMGRKVMGNSTWNKDNGAPLAAANVAFGANFQPGDYGSSGLTKGFVEDGGTVTGTASIQMPMLVMKSFGTESKTLTVTCDADMRVPNTDVMFVLDTTGSMDDKAVESDPTNKITALKTVVKCFYESLAKENIDDITPQQCNETADPVNGNAANVDLRIGFVPYAINANVGRLLPTDAMANSWTYQSRKPVYQANTVNTSTVGAYGSPVTTGTTTGNPSTDSWSNLSSNVVVGGTTYYYTKSQISAANCTSTSFNPPPPTQASTTTGTTNEVNPTSITYPQTTHTKTYQATANNLSTQYRYVTQSNNRCRLQSRVTTTPVTTNTSRTASVTWSSNSNQVFNTWSYEPVTFDISDLKSGTNWDQSLQLPLGTGGANTTINWSGCIEERQTVRVMDNDPSDNWAPIPENAYDMNINMSPEVGNTPKLWGPSLAGAVRARYSLDGNGQPSNSRTVDNVLYNGSMGGISDSCPTLSKLHQVWAPSSFKSYVNGLSTGGNTYHDIGLIWGGRLASPRGMFASLTAPADKQIERHMIFMTDGDTVTSTGNYTPYGLNWWDRRQTDPNVAPTTSLLDANVDARTNALCTAIKNENITLWVVSFGAGVSSETNQRLAACASPGKFMLAANSAQLLSEFKGMASAISSLRLTN